MKRLGVVLLGALAFAGCGSSGAGTHLSMSVVKGKSPTCPAKARRGSAGAGSGLAYRIVESGYRLNIPRMFAALLLLSLSGIVIFFALSFVSYLLLRRWHESALAGEI